jgi:hypothetical protein
MAGAEEMLDVGAKREVELGLGGAGVLDDPAKHQHGRFGMTGAGKKRVDRDAPKPKRSSSSSSCLLAAPALAALRAILAGNKLDGPALAPSSSASSCPSPGVPLPDMPFALLPADGSLIDAALIDNEDPLSPPPPPNVDLAEEAGSLRFGAGSIPSKDELS